MLLEILWDIEDWFLDYPLYSITMTFIVAFGIFLSLPFFKLLLTAWIELWNIF